MIRVVIGAIVAVHFVLILWGARLHSPTVDEPAYLASGISHWEFGRFDLCQVTPPLVRLVAAVPVRMANPTLDWSTYRTGPGIRSEHPAGLAFVKANGPRTLWLFTLGRWGCVPFSLLGAWVSYRWAKDLFGTASAVAALVLWCFSPNILGHAQLLTPDVGVTALSFASAYSIWKWSRAPSWFGAAVSGAVLGLAVLAKTNALALYPSLALGVLIDSRFSPALRSVRVLSQVVVGFLVSLYVINLGYGFEGSMKPLGEYEFFSTTLGAPQGSNRFRATAIAALPIPIPSAFLQGMDLQRRDFENRGGSMKTYFRGQWYDHGWWWYYAYVVAVKEPIGTWIVGLIALVGVLALRSSRAVDLACYVVIPGLTLFGLACSQTGFGHSLRYVLPAFPFAYLVTSFAISSAMWSSLRSFSMVALVWSVTSSLCVFPHTLSYFSEVAGGARNGHYHLLDGNVDWCQDLLFVERWVRSHPDAKPVYVDYWGFVSASDLGLDFQRSDVRVGEQTPPGWYIISVNHLRGEYRQSRPELAHFLEFSPEARIGYTSCVYRQQ